MSNLRIDVLRTVLRGNVYASEFLDGLEAEIAKMQAVVQAAKKQVSLSDVIFENNENSGWLQSKEGHHTIARYMTAQDLRVALEAQEPTENKEINKPYNPLDHIGVTTDEMSDHLKGISNKLQEPTDA